MFENMICIKRIVVEGEIRSLVIVYMKNINYVVIEVLKNDLGLNICIFI